MVVVMLLVLIGMNLLFMILLNSLYVENVFDGLKNLVLIVVCDCWLMLLGMFEGM